MGQHMLFNPGWEAPNDGEYIEVGEHPDSAGIHHPKKIHLDKGDKFPETSNPDRLWTRIKPHSTK